MGRKDAQLNRIIQAVDVIQDHGIVVNGCFIVGADGETNQSLDRLTSFISDSQLAEVQVTVQTPFPGTALYRRLENQSRLLDRSWTHYNLFDVVYAPDRLSVSQLESGLRRVLAEVFGAAENRKRKRLRHQIWRSHPGWLRSSR